MTQKVYISWAECWQIAHRLHNQLQSQEVKFDHILAIARGGLVPGAMLSYLSGAPMKSARLTSYVEAGAAGGGVQQEVVGELPEPIGEALIVDEILDSGATYNYIRARTARPFVAFYTKQSVTALQAKDPHFYAGSVWSGQPNKWLVFPWEA